MSRMSRQFFSRVVLFRRIGLATSFHEANFKQNVVHYLHTTAPSYSNDDDNEEEAMYQHPHHSNTAITPWARTVVSGVDLLRNPKYNKGMAFDYNERERMHLQGLLPPGKWEQSLQVERVLTVLKGMSDPLMKYTFLMGLQERNEKLFFRVLIENIEQMMPIIYSPTVSKACARYGLLFRRPRGLFITVKDSGKVLQILKNWPEKRVKLLAVSDGQNTLGLGDMGIQGMGNLVGKLSLFTACGGIHPSDCLPVMIDVGSDNVDLMLDKFYLGVRHKRVYGDDYDALMDEFMEAVRKRFGSRVLIQFENFLEPNAQRIVDRYRGSYQVFNDDIQGIAASVLAGIMAATTKDVNNIGGNGGPLSKHTFLFAGSSGLHPGIPEMLATAIAKETKEMIHEARKRIWLLSDKGLVVRAREESLRDKCLPYAHDFPKTDTLLEAIHKLKPSVLIGSADKPMTFNKEIIVAMASHNKHPIIISASNPAVGPHEVLSSEDVMKWTDGRAIFIPAKVEPEFSIGNKMYKHRCLSSSYISPGLALGSLLSGLTTLRESLFILSADSVASMVTDEDRRKGSYFPDINDSRQIAMKVAHSVMSKAYDLGIATNTPKADNLMQEIKNYMYLPTYRRYR